MHHMLKIQISANASMFNGCGSNFLSFEEKKGAILSPRQIKEKTLRDTVSELSQESMVIIPLLCHGRLTNKHPSAR